MRLLFDDQRRVIYTAPDIARILGTSARIARILLRDQIPSFRWMVNGVWVNVALASDVESYKSQRGES